MGDDDDNDQDDSESVGANTPDLIVSTVTTDIPSPDGEGGMSVTVKITTKPRKARAKVDPVPLTAEELEAQQRERDAKAEIRAAAKLGITVDELRDRRAEEYVEHSRRIAEQVAIDRVGLAPHHVADWKKFWPDVQTPEGFLEMVCNRQTVLNQKRQGDLVHFPCHTLHDNPFQDVQEGWRTDRPYLLILPSPAVEDVAGNWRLSSHDPVSSFLRNELTSLGIPLEECMVTYACRFPLPVGTKTYNSGHQTACSPYVRADALACRPQVIVAFGAVALKALLGQKTKLDTHRGDVETWEGIPVIPTQSPLQFMAGWGTIEVFRDELQRALEIRQGVYRRDAIDRSGHRVIRTVQEMRELVDTIEAAAPRHIAFDFEFGSLVKRKEALLCRSLQISWAAGQAAFIVLRGDNGAHVHSMEDYDEMWRLSHRILADPRWRLDGHHVRVDAQRMWEAGYSIDHKVETSFCSLLVHHLLHGDDDQGLDQLVRKYLPWMGAYWKELELWLDANGRSHHLQYGYLTVPEPIIIPYGLIDADAAWRIAEMLEVELKAEPRLWDLYWQITAPANLHIMDVERQGITVDDAQRMRLRDIIKPEFEAIVREFREIAKWKDFDPAKAWQIAEYLYSGTAFKGKKGQKKHEGDETGKVPHTAILLDLPPPFNTDKYPLQWEDIEAKGENHLHSPSTKSAAIELLIAQHPEIEELRYLKFMSVLGKYLNTYLTPIAIDPETNLPAEGKSFSANIGDDGKVRGTIHQISETGRWRMTGPNLQCNPKKQESAVLEAFVYRRFGGMSLSEYQKRTNDKKPPPDLIPREQRIDLPSFKSVYIADPGCCFIEVDYKTAEVAAWAYASGDDALIAMITQKRDIHCEVATDCFKLPVADDLKAALEELNGGVKNNDSLYATWEKKVKTTYEALRTVAKAVLFGLIYGRGANALSREINKQGVETTPEKCQETIDGIATKFPKAWAWLQAAQKQAIEMEYVENVYGFRRYFKGVQSLGRTEQAKVKRQAGNAAVQGLIAQLFSMSGINFYRFRYRTEVGRKLRFQNVLPIHDAHLIQLPLESFKPTQQIIRICMTTANKIPGTDHTIDVDMNGDPAHRWSDH